MGGILRFLSFRPFTGRHVMVLFIAFFGTIFAVNFYMASRALDSWTGLIARNGYIATKELADRRDRERPAREAGWQVAATVEDGVVTVETRDAADNPLSRAVVGAVAERPVMDRDDRPVILDKIGYGRYVAREPLPEGRWYLDVTVVEGEMELTQRFSFVVSGERS